MEPHLAPVGAPQAPERQDKIFKKSVSDIFIILIKMLGFYFACNLKLIASCHQLEYMVISLKDILIA